MDHAATMRRAYELINAHDVEGFAELLSDDFAAFSDLRFEVEDIIASGDKVVGRFRMIGTNDGDFMGMPATGRSVDVQGIDIIRFNDDGVGVEHWGVFDTMAMMQQLGVVPEGAPA